MGSGGAGLARPGSRSVSGLPGLWSQCRRGLGIRVGSKPPLPCVLFPGCSCTTLGGMLPGVGSQPNPALGLQPRMAQAPPGGNGGPEPAPSSAFCKASSCPRTWQAQGSRPGALINYRSPRSRACDAGRVPAPRLRLLGCEKGGRGRTEPREGTEPQEGLSWGRSLSLQPQIPQVLRLPASVRLSSCSPSASRHPETPRAGLVETLGSSRIWAELSPRSP